MYNRLCNFRYFVKNVLDIWRKGENDFLQKWLKAVYYPEG